MGKQWNSDRLSFFGSKITADGDCSHEIKGCLLPERKAMTNLAACCCQVASVVSNSVWPHRRQPTRLLRPWDSPGKNTGVGCHFLLQCMKVESKSEVTQLCLTLSDPMDCSLPGSSIHGIFRATVLEWGAIAFSHLGYCICINEWNSSGIFFSDNIFFWV